MPVTLICPNLTCGQTVVAPDALRGKVVRCAHCGKHFVVPVRAGELPSKDDANGNNKKKAHGGTKRT